MWSFGLGMDYAFDESGWYINFVYIECIDGYWMMTVTMYDDGSNTIATATYVHAAAGTGDCPAGDYSKTSGDACMPSSITVT